MTRYPIYLEIAGEGRCMAHVPDLPGCIVRAPSRDQALRQLPDAIRDYHAWLRRHGEPAPPAEEPIEIEVAGESTGFGPFDPGDAAALFPPDQQPVTADEMERCFRLMAHARTDLLALVRDLPDELLDWQPDSQSFPLRRLLRHIGNAEKWYVSRLLLPEALPAEWEHDEDLPLFEFLAMERPTAIARLRQLTAEERARVFYPTHWTQHPEEPWTARKALRRFLEHEREHTAQIRDVLASWRDHLLAGLAAERARLLEQFLALDERALTEMPVFADWTAKDLLAHVAAWDEFHTERIEQLLAGREEEITAVDMDAHNAALHAQRQDWPLEKAVQACLSARAAFLAALARLPDEGLHRQHRFSWGEASVRRWAQNRARHDAMHTADLAAWRQKQSLEDKTGPKAILLAALTAAREELLAATALVPADERASRLVCGEWTLKDVLGHVADWEWLVVEALRQMASGCPPEVEFITNVEAWNRAHAQARLDQPWAEVWSDWHAARQALLEALEGMSQADLGRVFPSYWTAEAAPYDWVHVLVAHDREHAAELRMIE